MRQLLVLLNLCLFPLAHAKIELSVGAGGGAHDFSQDVEVDGQETTLSYSSFDMILTMALRAGVDISNFEIGGLVEAATGNRSMQISDEKESFFKSAQAQSNYLQYAAAVFLGWHFAENFRVALEYYPLAIQSITYAEGKDENMHRRGDSNQYQAAGLSASYCKNNIVYTIGAKAFIPTSVNVAENSGQSASDMDKVQIMQSQMQIGYRF